MLENAGPLWWRNVKIFFLEEKWWDKVEEYCGPNHMLKSEEWGGNLEIIALCNHFQLDVVAYTQKDPTKPFRSYVELIKSCNNPGFSVRNFHVLNLANVNQQDPNDASRNPVHWMYLRPAGVSFNFLHSWVDVKKATSNFTTCIIIERECIFIHKRKRVVLKWTRVQFIRC